MKRKFWLGIAILLIVGIVLAIVFVSLFRERDTEDLSKSLNNYVEDGYLNVEDERFQDITDYLDYIAPVLKSNVDTAEQGLQAENFLNSYKATIVVAKFVNEELIFLDYSDAYRQNKKKIEKAFSQAQTSARELQTFINENVNEGGSQYWLANTWQGCEENATKMVEKSLDAIKRLLSVYEEGATSVYTGNAFLEIIFDRTEFLLDTMIENQQTENSGKNLYEFVVDYFTNKEAISNYCYNSDLQTKVEDIKEKGDQSVYYDSFCEGTLGV